MEILVYLLCGIALLTLVGSIFLERMMGIEMIQVLQATLFTIPTMGSIPSGLAPLTKLRYSNGYNFISGNDAARTSTFTFVISAIGIEK